MLVVEGGGGGTGGDSLLPFPFENGILSYWKELAPRGANFGICSQRSKFFPLRWPTLIFSENSVLENFLILKQCIIQLQNFRKK